MAAALCHRGGAAAPRTLRAPTACGDLQRRAACAPGSSFPARSPGRSRRPGRRRARSRAIEPPAPGSSCRAGRAAPAADPSLGADAAGAGQAARPRVTFLADVRADHAAGSCARATAPTTTRRTSCWRTQVQLVPADGRVVRRLRRDSIEEPRYLFCLLPRNEHVAVRPASSASAGVLSVARSDNPAVCQRTARRSPAEGHRRRELRVLDARSAGPAGTTWRLRSSRRWTCSRPENVANGVARPTNGPNAWVAHSTTRSGPDSALGRRRRPSPASSWASTPTSTTRWRRYWGHPERAMPFCVKALRVCIDGRDAAMMEDNHQSRRRMVLDEPTTARTITLEVLETWSDAAGGGIGGAVLLRVHTAPLQFSCARYWWTD